MLSLYLIGSRQMKAVPTPSESHKFKTQTKNTIYYMEESVLLETKPLVDSIRHFIRDPSIVFSVSVVSFNDVTISAFCFC